mmetsp:Transcript_138065/g.240113  ORF Transcript_138065/g.240113 Transcript_138065/m.240113 type:complete len:206 (-) Transcript_138065:804-1421(-)
MKLCCLDKRRHQRHLQSVHSWNPMGMSLVRCIGEHNTSLHWRNLPKCTEVLLWCLEVRLWGMSIHRILVHRRHHQPPELTHQLRQSGKVASHSVWFLGLVELVVLEVDLEFRSPLGMKAASRCRTRLSYPCHGEDGYNQTHPSLDPMSFLPSNNHARHLYHSPLQGHRGQALRHICPEEHHYDRVGRLPCRLQSQWTRVVEQLLP